MIGWLPVGEESCADSKLVPYPGQELEQKELRPRAAWAKQADQGRYLPVVRNKVARACQTSQNRRQKKCRGYEDCFATGLLLQRRSSSVSVS